MIYNALYKHICIPDSLGRIWKSIKMFHFDHWFLWIWLIYALTLSCKFNWNLLFPMTNARFCFICQDNASKDKNLTCTKWWYNLQKMYHCLSTCDRNVPIVTAIMNFNTVSFKCENRITFVPLQCSTRLLFSSMQTKQ